MKTIYTPIAVSSGELPEEQIMVHLIYEQPDSNKEGVAVGFYTKGGVMEFDDEDDNFPDCYDEVKGVSLLPKGFYTCDNNDEKITGLLPTHWLKKEEVPELTEEGSYIDKLISYFEQQLRLQRSSVFQYTPEECLVDAIDVCKNAKKASKVEVKWEDNQK